jgi:hypothetical protein
MNEPFMETYIAIGTEKMTRIKIRNKVFSRKRRGTG